MHFSTFALDFALCVSLTPIIVFSVPCRLLFLPPSYLMFVSSMTVIIIALATPVHVFTHSLYDYYTLTY